MPDSMKDLLTTYLVDVHSIEEQALQQLRKAPEIAGEPRFAEALRTPAKLAVFAYAFEHLEIGGYEQLKRVAARADDSETVRAVEQILGEERRAADLFVGAIDEALTASFASASDRPKPRKREARDTRPRDQHGTARN